MQYLFLQKDFDCLKKEQEKLIKKHIKIGQDLGEACGQSSETWHDNAPRDDAINNAKLNEESLSKIEEILLNSKIVEIPREPFLKVKIGNLVKIIDEDGNEKLYEIGSFISCDENKRSKKSKQASYTSPLGNCLLDKKVGETCILKTENIEKELKILEIN